MLKIQSLLARVTRFKSPALMLLGMTLLSCSLLPISSVQAIPETARPADAFVDSIGVNTHLRYYDTAYQNYSLLKQRLLEAGIRHIRDGGSDPEWIRRIKDLGAAGIKSTVVVDTNIGVGPNSSYTMNSPAYGVSQFLTLLGPANVDAVEILNEFDLSYQLFPNGYKLNGQPLTSATWVGYLRDFTRDTYAAVKGNPTTQGVQVIGPSFVYSNSSTAVGDLSAWVDSGNMHPYNYPDYPGNGNLQRDMANRSLPFAGKPMSATETGYHTADLLTSDRPITITAHDKYIPRLFLTTFNQGVNRTFAYELIDERAQPANKESNFGLLKNDGTPKPAFNSLKNLIQLLQDPGTPFVPEALDYSLTGANASIRHTLLQKRDKSFYLVLWQETSSYDPWTKQDVKVPNNLVTVNLAAMTRKATIYRPNLSNLPQRYFTWTRQFQIGVSDTPVVIQLSP